MRRWIAYIRNGFSNYRFKSLFWQSFRLIFVGLALPLMIMLVAVYSFSQDILKREIEVANLRALDTVESIISTIYNEAQIAATKIIVDEDVLLSLRSDAPRSFADYERVRRVMNTLELSRKNAFFDSITLYTEEGNYFIANDGYGTRMPYAADQSLLGYYESLPYSENIWILRKMRSAFVSEPISVLTFLRRIGSVRSSGMLAINIREDTLRQLLGGLHNPVEGVVLLLGSDGTLLFDSVGDPAEEHIAMLNKVLDPQALPGARGTVSMELGSERYMVAYSRMPGTPWICAQSLPYRTYAGSLTALQGFVLLSIALGFGISFVLALVIAERLSRPIRNIISYIDTATLENPIAPVDNELNYILLHLITLYDDNKTLESERLSRYGALRQSQAHALQAQLTPHFLNNTLQAIQWLVLRETKNEESPAMRALVRLSGLARDTMEDHGNLTTLGRELEFVDRYIELQKLRYLDSINFEQDVPELLLDTVVPRFCLQPLIENAIEYMKKGRIRIEAAPEGGDLIILVSDNGRGMAEEDMEAYNRSFTEDGEPFIRHIGLGNLNQRIRLLFGEEYRLMLKKTPGGGLTVRIRIPFRQDAQTVIQ